MFKVGIFYIFLENDARNISNVTTLKLVMHSKNNVKCGFPENSLDKYLNLFERLNIDVKIIDEYDADNTKIYKTKKIFRYLNNIKNINLDKISPIESMKILKNLKDIL